MMGIMNAQAVAMVTKRSFFINWNSARGSLLGYLIPSEENWVVAPACLRVPDSEKIDVSWIDNGFPISEDDDLEEKFFLRKKVAFLRSNVFMVQLLSKRLVFDPVSIRDRFRKLFKPSPTLEQYLSKYSEWKNMDCIQVWGYNQNFDPNMWKRVNKDNKDASEEIASGFVHCLRSINSPASRKTFVVTDVSTIRDHIIRLLGSDNVLYVMEGSVVHIDRDPDEGRANFFRVILETWILRQCSRAVISHSSNFGRVGLFLGDIDLQNIYGSTAFNASSCEHLQGTDIFKKN